MAIFLFVAGLAFLIIGAEALVRGASRLAADFGISPLVIGLTVVATIALARSIYVMSKKNVLINKLQAVETLGSTGVIFTDKTGTLTGKKMAVRTVAAADEAAKWLNEQILWHQT